MAVPPGTRFGHFEIHSALGAGGMGEVYRARDTRLDRDVAIKILPDGFAADATARERFQREAKSIAALNHPHICTLHDIGQEGASAFLVMELVDGDTLSALIAKGPVPLAIALAIAGQIADALDKAHRAGIAHRDLKPANVMLAKQAGAIHVKLLDFGLAKPAGILAASSASQVAAPTMTANPSLTAAGSIVGTLHYMAPEQLEGKDADTRSDIWAFGCVLYEMLTGTRPFDAKSSVGLMAAILEHEPAPMAARVPLTPPALEHIVTRCLAKDPEARWQSARDLAVELRWIAQGGGHERSALAIAASRPRSAGWATAAVVAVAAALLGTAAGARWLTVAAIADDRVAFDIEAPSPQLDSIAVSPDGRFIVYSGTADGASHLILREISSTAARILPGTLNAAGPFWSPDSRSVGFFTPTELRRIDLTGGDSIRIALLPVSGGQGSQGSWSESGLILFGQVTGAGIRSVSDQGGPLAEVTTVRAEKLERNHIYPRFLPGGRAFLYLRISGPDFTENSLVVHHALDTSEERVVLKAYSRIEFADPDWLLYTQGQEPTLLAQRINVANGSLVGGFRTLVSGILRINPQSPRPISASARLLAYRVGQFAPSKLTWFNRRGETLSVASSTTQVENASSSLDGSLIVSNGASASSQSQDVWLTDTRRDSVVTRLTFDKASDSDPIFSPDGKAIVFYSNREPIGLYRRPTSGGAEELLAATGQLTWPRDWSRNGRYITVDKGGDIELLTLGTPPTTSTLIKGPGKTMGRFSPDMKSIAYVSDETGRNEVFVQDFPLSGARWQISMSGGIEPRWREDGRELFFLDALGRLMAVDINREPVFTPGDPRALFQTRLRELLQGSLRRFSVLDMGQRFLMNVPVDDQSRRPITMVLNWQSLINKDAR